MRVRIWSGIVLIILTSAGFAAWLHRRTMRYDELIAQSASRYELDFYLVKAIIYEESWFRSDIRGSSGELGLMQVMKGAAADFTMRNGLPAIREDSRILDPRVNIEIGCWYLRQSLDHYRNSPAPELFALLRYNAGEARADGWMRAALANPVPLGLDREAHYLSLVNFPKTREYVRRILRRWRSRNFWF
jgi:soluble lytic murein transglycosylase